MFIKINSAVLVGVEAKPVTIEIDISKSWPGFQVVGLGDAAIQEAKERIRIAWKNTLSDWPFGKGITINLAPADLRKEGTGYDLPMAIGMYLAHYEIITPELDDALIIGELALDGTIRPVPGVLPMATYAAGANLKKIFIPPDGFTEASLVPNLTVYPVTNFLDLINHLLGKKRIIPTQTTSSSFIPNKSRLVDIDFAHIKGQEFAKRALEIAAAGAHNILLSGTPGAGKTMLAKALPGILPRLNQTEIIEVTTIYSAAGLLNPKEQLIIERPFRAPHHSASVVSLVGGGKNPRPGEASLAHRGVLYLDELPEFPRYVLDSLRQPLEDRTITVSRATGSVTFPAQFMLVASQNPCPCGFLGDTDKTCSCPPIKIFQYQKKISGPLLDRIDLQINVPRVNLEKLVQTNDAENSAAVATRVFKARQIQSQRFSGDQSHKQTNSEMQSIDIKRFCVLDENTTDLLKQAASKLKLSARGYHRIIKVARTIADLANEKHILLPHVAEALQYRGQNLG